MRRWSIMVSMLALLFATAAVGTGNAKGPSSKTMEKGMHSFHVVSVGWAEDGWSDFGDWNHGGDATFILMEDGLHVWFNDSYNEHGVECGEEWWGDSHHNFGFDSEWQGTVEGELHLNGKKGADGAHAWALLFMGGDEGHCDEGGGFGDRPMVVEITMEPSDTMIRDRSATFVRGPDASSHDTMSFTGYAGGGTLAFYDVWYDWDTGTWEVPPEGEGFYEEFAVDGRFGEAKSSTMTRS